MKRHTPEEIITKLRRVEALTAEGSTVADAVREIGVTEVTYYRWRKTYADVGKPEARRLRELEKENARLKKLVADLSPKATTSSANTFAEGGRAGKVLSPARKREAVAHVQRQLGVSERRACRVVGQPRSTHRYTPERPAQDRALVARLLQLSRQHPRYGYRRAWAVLRGQGWAVNKKRVHRLWREAGLQVPQKAQKRRRAGTGENSTVRLAPEHPNHIWC